MAKIIQDLSAYTYEEIEESENELKTDEYFESKDEIEISEEENLKKNIEGSVEGISSETKEEIISELKEDNKNLLKALQEMMKLSSKIMQREIKENAESLMTENAKKEDENFVEINNSIKSMNELFADQIDISNADIEFERKFGEIELELKEHRRFVDNLEEKTKKAVKNIVKKIVGLEISSQSDKIILTNIGLLFNQIKEAKSLKVMFNDGEFEYLKNRITGYFEKKGMKIENLKFEKDKSIKKGSFLILSDIGNFDNNLEEKMKLILDSIF